MNNGHSSHGGHSNSAHSAHVARDAYASTDPHQRRDAYAHNDPYKTDKAAANRKEKRPPSIYGYGHFCDQFFLIQDRFRAWFNSDTELHTEKRDYVGSGDIASVLPLFAKKIGASFTLEFFALVIVYALFLSDFAALKFFGGVVFFALLLWRFFCPAYLVYSSGQYVIGDRFKAMFKQYRSGYAFVEFSYLFIFGIFLVFIYAFHDFIVEAGALLLVQSELVENAQLSKVMAYFGTAIVEDGLTNSYQFAMTFGSFFVFYFFAKILILRRTERLRVENYKESFVRRLSSVYQRKSFILDGEVIDTTV
ncbi:hypothetical protein ACXWTF_12560 [Thiomicrolovo sp. ZZH C-3]